MKRGNTAENAIFCSFIWCANLANGLVQKSKKEAAIYKALKSQLSFSEDMFVTTLLHKWVRKTEADCTFLRLTKAKGANL